jgi:hypothetical protein
MVRVPPPARHLSDLPATPNNAFTGGHCESPSPLRFLKPPRFVPRQPLDASNAESAIINLRDDRVRSSYH